LPGQIIIDRALARNRITQEMSKRRANDCWNRIGIWGKADCPNIEEFVHCRNCPVFSHEGRALLDRECSEEYLIEWTAVLARQKKVEAADTLSVVIFRVGREWLALDTVLLEKIVSIRPIHTIPHRSSAILLGLTNIKGDLMLCASLAHILGLEEIAPEKTERSRRLPGRLMVIAHDNTQWVFPVDEVESIFRFPIGEMEKVPSTVAGSAMTYSRGIFKAGAKRVALLDVHLLFGTLKRSISWQAMT
jgi:chemotaxis-related protein WspD